MTHDDPITTTPTALVVVAHHRAASLTAHIGDVAAERLMASGYAVDLLNLQSEGFDPRMTVADEPDWDNRDKRYSEEVHRHMDRIRRADLLVPVFPVYWLSVPALLKGWIDRVWNYGIAYGRSNPPLAGKRMLWLGLAGAPADDPSSDSMRELLEAQLTAGLAYYCGITDSRLELLYESEGEPQRTDEHGTLVIGEALDDATRAAHFTAFAQRAADLVERFATAGALAGSR